MLNGPVKYYLFIHKIMVVIHKDLLPACHEAMQSMDPKGLQSLQGGKAML